MKELTPKGIAIRVAFLIATITVASLFIGLLFFDCNLPFYLFLLLFIITLLTSYFGFLYALEKFIYRKIKLIYRTIHNQKLKKDGEIEDLNFSDNIIQKVQQDVLDWAKTNQQEITRLKTSENYRREFVGNVSHELKTPIFNIQGYLLTLIEGGMDDPTINKDYLVKANNSVERMIDIIEDLHEITKLERARLSMKIDKKDIVELVKQVVDSLEERINKTDVTVKIQNQDKPIWVMDDARKIRKVLFCLTIKAIKYGKINGTIRIKFFDMHNNI